jgi:YVTN family beta-propeller protein
MSIVKLGPRAKVFAVALSFVMWPVTGGVRLAEARPLFGPSNPPTRSSPIAISSDDRFVWAVNRENNSVSVFDVGSDLNQKVREIKVGAEPRSIAITPDRHKVYVTNMVGGTVSVINATTFQATKAILVGTEPFGCALTPDGGKLYVANFVSDNVSVINTTTDQVIKTIPVPAGNNKPRAIAISTDGKVYVTSFLAHLRDDGRTIDQKEGRDDGKEGHVTVISSTSDTVIGTVLLNPLADTGFLSNGSVLDRIPTTDPPTFTFTTGAFPNLLQGVAIKGGHAYLPNVGSSPNGPFRFNVNVQGLLSVIDTASDVDAGLTLNMNRGVQFENVSQKLFNTTPITIAFKQSANEGFVVLGGTDRLIRVVLAADGTPSVNAPASLLPPGTKSNIIRIPVGKNPVGIVINSADTRAYVLNFISRDVSAVDISGNDPTLYHEIKKIQSAALPAAGTQDAIIHLGHELFNTSIGPEGTLPTSKRPAGRMSDTGWGNCYNCHPDGLHDGVSWLFPDGPRQSISMESTGEHPQPPGSQLNANGAPSLPSFKQRVLNWSAVRDEVQDFELNIRAVSGGEGLITDGQAVVNLTPTATTGRSALLDAIAAYVTQGIRAPISPVRPKNVGGGQVDPEIAQGRVLFAAANCQQCHGGPSWTRSRIDFTPPPLAETITVGQLVRFLKDVGTFDSTAFNEVRGAGTTIVNANGVLGFNIPSLVSVSAGAPYFHSGAAPRLDDVVNNVTHRSAGTGGVDTLASAADRARIVKFLTSIDSKTTIFP